MSTKSLVNHIYMIKDIVKDDFFLAQVSTDATIDDLYICQDLSDTLNAHRDHCVGMAANMIGYQKNIIIIDDNAKQLIMLNPKVLEVSDETYDTSEGCLSHSGEKSVTRHTKIKVEYYNQKFQKKTRTFKDFTAQIVQHELDHLEGILI